MKIRPVDGGKSVMFECPGCGENHGFPVDGSRGWSWNGDVDRPTITPSILARGHKFVSEDSDDTIPYICHSFVTDGRIQFLSDCTHANAGQTVDLLEVEAMA